MPLVRLAVAVWVLYERARPCARNLLGSCGPWARLLPCRILLPCLGVEPWHKDKLVQLQLFKALDFPFLSRGWFWSQKSLQ